MTCAKWIRQRRVLVAAVGVASGVVGCRDTTTPPGLSKAGIPEASFTPAVDFNGTPLGRGNLGAFHIKSKASGFSVELKSKDNTDIAVSSIVVPPGGHSGWHFHPGPVVVLVTAGEITFYHGSDANCSGIRHPAGTAFIEEGGVVGIARNEGTVTATVVATFFAPLGVATRLDANRPGNCAF